MLRTLASAFVALALGCTPSADDRQRQPQPVNTNAAIMADFVKRVEAYVALHKKVEATLPDLKDKGTPESIDKHERAMEQLMRTARKDAKQGDLFTPAMQKVVRDLLRPIFSGPDARQIKAEILDNEYKGNVKLVVNGRYPDEIPISTVPPQVLAQLPKLPEELEYRFIQTNLILFDPHAHIIADYIVQAFQ
jgi:hypothetical protein